MEGEDEKRGIFAGDARFGEEQERPKIEEKSFKAGFSNLGEGIGHIFKGFWHIFSKKFHMNVLILMLIIALVATVFYFGGLMPIATEDNKTTQRPMSITFPENVDTSLLGVEGIENIIEANCVSDGLEPTLRDLSCPVPECPTCDDTKSCPECVCNAETKNVIHYQCLNGDFVKDKLNCWQNGRS